MLIIVGFGEVHQLLCLHLSMVENFHNKKVAQKTILYNLPAYYGNQQTECHRWKILLEPSHAPLFNTINWSTVFVQETLTKILILRFLNEVTEVLSIINAAFTSKETEKVFFYIK
jgi:hypothetical protein